MPVSLTWPDEFTARIRGIAKSDSSIREVMPELEKLVRKDNREGLLAGLDRNGIPFVPLSKWTIENRVSAMGFAYHEAPPLIPAKERSRVIANYRTTSGKLSRGSWVIIGVWENVLSKTGEPFLQNHIDGTKYLPQRDLAGVRPVGREAVGAALKTWFRERFTK